MYVRCVACQGSTWIRTLPPRGGEQAFACEGCGREQNVKTPETLTGNTKQQYQTALAFAEDHDVDLPSAYSVLLGLMTIGQARGNEAEAPVVEEPKEPRARGRTRSRPSLRVGLDYDPGFADAVAEGFLTVKQARERGDRDALARSLMAEHALPTVLAYLVADNKLTIDVALRRVRDERLAEDLRAGRRIPASRRQLAWIAGLTASAALGILVFAFVLWDHQTDLPLNAAPPLAPVVGEPEPSPAPDTAARAEPSAPTAPHRGTAELVRDDEGRLVRIAARTPEAVLEAFCEAFAAPGQLQVMGVVSGVPATASTRLGVYRDFRDLEVPFAIRIRRARDERVWTTGSGRGPIVPLRNPHLPTDDPGRAALYR